MLLLFFLVQPSFAQREKVKALKAVRGEFAVVLNNMDITGREAAQRAREDAKRKALEQVCGVHVNIWDMIESSSRGESLNSLSINQIDGEIVEFHIVKEDSELSAVRPEETIFYCIADIKVKQGVKADPAFAAEVNGIRSVYFAGETLLFQVKPHKDCYMKLFLLEDNKKGYMLYPNKYDRSGLLQADTLFKIEENPHYEIVMGTKDADKDEVNTLVFVFTKTERAFSEQETSRAEIEKWIATIPNDQKYLHFSVVEVRNK